MHVYQLFVIPTEDNLTPRRQSELEILNLTTKTPKRISYFLLICWPLMKWVNPQQKFFLRFTLSFAKSVILIYIWLVCWLYFLWIVIRPSQLGVIHFWHHVTLYLASNGCTWKFCMSFQWWYIQTYPENWKFQLSKARRWS